MTKTSKISLALCIAALALSFTEAGGDLGWGILRPLGVAAFGVFFINNLLAKEMALYDEEENAKLNPQPRRAGAARPSTPPSGTSRLSRA